MNSFFLFSCLFAAAAAKPGFLSYSPVVTTHQYHAQDALGQYAYGYSGGPSAKEETKTADGITRGSYSYIDAHGIVQSASYVSDPINGFRVAATNLPVGPSAPAPAVVAAPAVVSAPAVVAAPAVVSAPAVVAAPAVVSAPAVVDGPLETPEVIAAKAAHFAAHHEALARLGRKKRSVVTSYQAPLAYSAPAATVVSGPAVVAAKTATVVAAAPAIVETPTSVAYSTPGSAVVSSSAPITGSFSYSSSSVAASPVTTVHAAPAVVAAKTVAPAVVAASPVTTVHAAPAIVETPSSVAYSTVDSSVVSSTAPVSGSFSYSSSSVAASPVPAETAAVVSAPVVATAAAPVVAESYAAPVVAAAPFVAHSYHAPVVAATSSQYRAQDNIGQYSYGYSDHLSSKHESRAADGTTFGKYSYVDSNGIVQSVKYVADHAGFRAHATNLPVA